MQKDWAYNCSEEVFEHLEAIHNLITIGETPSGDLCIKDVKGDVHGDVRGMVEGTINNRWWVFMETREEKFRRLLHETGDTQLIDAFDQLKENS